MQLRAFLAGAALVPAIILAGCATPAALDPIAGAERTVPLITSQPTVRVAGGMIRGSVTDGDFVFRGIPFAAPPTGERRWTPPGPVQDWDGVRDTTRNAPACPQYSEGWNQAQADFWDEDCLTIDVRTQSLDGTRPVMVWIHGGSNRAGSGGGPADSNLDDHGIVHVSIQYRLGLLGFLSHPQLSAAQGGHSGNYGLMDQVAGLRWVRDNIAAFGGDPDNVTIYGESAGGLDVALLLSSPLAEGLFDRALIQSATPTGGSHLVPLAVAETRGSQLGKIEDLRDLPAAELLELQRRYEAGAPRLTPFLQPTLDGKVLPKAPSLLLEEREPVPVVLGTDRVEFTGPDEGDAYIDLVLAYFGEAAEEALELYASEDADPRRGGAGTRAISDAVFHCPADELADLLARNDFPTWRYEFDVGENGGLTRHAYEIGFVFGREPVGGGVQMQDYWAAFATAGDPNGATPIADPDRPFWRRYDPAAPQQLEFRQDAVEMEPGRQRAAACPLVF